MCVYVYVSCKACICMYVCMYVQVCMCGGSNGRQLDALLCTKHSCGKLSMTSIMRY